MGFWTPICRVLNISVGFWTFRGLNLNCHFPLCSSLGMVPFPVVFSLFLHSLLHHFSMQPPMALAIWHCIMSDTLMPLLQNYEMEKGKGGVNNGKPSFSAKRRVLSYICRILAAKCPWLHFWIFMAFGHKRFWLIILFWMSHAIVPPWSERR